MLIRVVYKDYKFDFVKPFRLDEFLESGRIAMFKRSSGWVFVGIDAVRAKKKYAPYFGPERRETPGKPGSIN